LLDSLTKAIRAAVPDAFVQGREATVLPTNLLDYDPTLRTQSGGGLPLFLWILVACGVVVVIVAVAMCCCRRHDVVVLTPGDMRGHFISIKMHDT